MGAEPRLAVEGLEVRLGGRAVLRGVDLRVEAGETVVVLGPSGGGKTTLLRAVAGLVVPDAGVIRLDDVDVAGVPPHRRDVGLMFQDHALFPHRDVGANVGFGLRMGGVASPERRRRVAEVLELVGLPGIERRSVASLSGGEAQRVALARALAPRPRLLLLDEPLGSLDRVLHDRLVDDLRALVREQQLTLVHVTHDQQEALALADRLVVLGDGVVLQDGAPDDLWRRPADEQVARFLGFQAVVSAAVRRGEAMVGSSLIAVDVPVPDGSWRLLLRPDAVVLLDGAEPHGAGVGGQVVEVVFRGGHTDVVVATEALGAVRVEVRGAAPDVGASVVVGVLGERVHALGPA